MERYGHDSPPKVMWGVDDDIRDLFKDAKATLAKLPDGSIEELSQKFEAFAKEFEEMIFKEEAILLMILLESFTQDDWLQIASESDAYGYAILKPTEKWIPHRESFDNEADADTSDNQLADALNQVQDANSPGGPIQKLSTHQKVNLLSLLNRRKKKQQQIVRPNSLLVTVIYR